MILYLNTSLLKISLYLFHIVASIESYCHSSMARVNTSKVVLIEISINNMSGASQFLQSYGINTLGDVTKINIQDLWSVFNGFLLASCMAIDISTIEHIQIGGQEVLLSSFGGMRHSRSLGPSCSNSLWSHLSWLIVDGVSRIRLIFDLPVEFCLSDIGGREAMTIQSGPKEILFVTQGSVWSLECAMFLWSGVL